MDYSNNYYQQPSIRKYVVLSVLAVALIAAVWWLATHAFLQITIPNAEGKKLQVSVARLGDDKVSTFETTDSSIKRLLPRGEYEITVVGDKDSAFVATTTGRFLTTRRIEAPLTAQKERIFIGNNPSPCMAYAGELFSYTCSGALADVNYHVPATSSLATYVEKSFADLEGTVQGTLSFNDKVLALVKTSQGKYAHNLFELRAEKLVRVADLTQLSASKNYVMKAHGDGFIVHSTTFDEAYFYSSPTASPTPITLGRANTANMAPESIEGGNNITAVVYAAADRAATQAFDEETSSDGTTEVAVTIGGDTRNYMFDTYHRAVRACADNTLCMLNGKELSVFDVSKKKAKLLYKVGGVQSIENTAKGFIAVRSSDVLHLDATTGIGFVGVSFPGYTMCGVQTGHSNYTLCLITSKQRKMALNVDMSADNSDSVETKLAQLIKVTGVESASIYKKFVYVVPDAGPPIYNERQGGFVTDKAVLNVVNERIDQALKNIGLQEPDYTITNPMH